MKKVRGFEIRHIEEEIVCSKAFLRKASQFGTEEYQAFIGIRRDFPSYTIRILEPKKAEAKMSMKGLTREFMEYYIIEHIGKESQDYIDFIGLKKMAQDDKGNYLPKTYMKMRKWFVEKYPNWDRNEGKRIETRKAKEEEKQKNAKATYAAIHMTKAQAGSEEEQAG